MKTLRLTSLVIMAISLAMVATLPLYTVPIVISIAVVVFCVGVIVAIVSNEVIEKREDVAAAVEAEFWSNYRGFDYDDIIDGVYHGPRREND